MAQPVRGRPGRREPPRKSWKRPLTLSALALTVFAAIVVARLPAGWALAMSGHELRCTRVAGSVWDGYCGGAQVSGTPLGNLSWQLHPARLLTGRLAAHVQAMRANASARADVTLSLGGTLVARDVVIDLPLEPSLLPALPPQITGKAHVDLTRIELTRAGVVKRIQGRVEVHDLVDSIGQVTPLGSFVVSFPGGGPGEPVGRLRDLGGPLAVEGTVRLTDQPGYDLQAKVAARSDAVPSLVQALKYLGSADAEGWRPFALSGTY